MVALVSGDAGMGKTRLVAELATVAAARGFMVLSGRCAELGDSVPYLPLADALRSAAHTSPALADAIAARPVLGLLLPDRDNAEMAGGDVPGMAQQQLFGAVLGMLAELAETAPVLLVLEDMHWADRSTRDLLTFLSRVLHRERIAVIATYRTDDLHRGHPLRAVAAELLRLPSVIAVEVGPLRDEAMAEHLTALAQQPLEAAELEAIIRRAEGNTYYAEELLAASACGTGLPAGLAELLLARLQRLSPAGPAGGARRGRGGPAGRGRPGPAGLRPGGARVRAGGPGGRREPVAGARRRGGLRLPARAAARGRLRRPAAGRADPAARDGWPNCSPTRSGCPPCRGPRPSWPITAWPATTSRALSARRCGPARRRTGSPRPRRRTGTSTRHWPCGNGSPTRRSWPACNAAGWRSSPRPAPRPAVTCTARCSSYAGC